MHARAFGMGAALALFACGSGLPNFEDPPEPADGTVVDGGERSDTGAVPRLLTDVTAPREGDGRSSGGAGGAPRDANTPDGDATSRDGPANGRDADTARGVDADTRDR